MGTFVIMSPQSKYWGDVSCPPCHIWIDAPACQSVPISQLVGIRSMSYGGCGSSLMVACSWTKARGFPDVWSIANSSRQRCCGSSLNFCSVRSSSSLTTSSWNKKSTMAGRPLFTILGCSFFNLSFNTSFDSTDNTSIFPKHIREYAAFPNGLVA